VDARPERAASLRLPWDRTGKSTELRRLRKRLQESDAEYLVILLDVQDYVNLSTPVDVSDFLMALAGAFGDALQAPELLDEDPSRVGYWERLTHFLQRTEITLNEISAEPGGVGLKATLKSDPSFKQQLQKHMAGHLDQRPRGPRFG